MNRYLLFATGVALLSVGYVGRAIADAAADDFQRRANSTGVIRAIGFDAASEVTSHILPDGQFTASGSGYDTSVHASGAGSMRFTVPALSAANTSGSWRINFSDDLMTTFGSGKDFYVQWRQRFDNTFINAIYAGSEGWKQLILGEGDHAGQGETGSCTEMDIVTQNQWFQGFPTMYHNCGYYTPFIEPTANGQDYKMQNAMPAPFCLYSDKTRAGCFKYYPNEWMTFQIHIRPGPRGTAMSSLEQKVVTGFTNSVVEMWTAREGQPAQLAISWTGVVIRETQGYEFGKVWLLPYQSKKDATVAGPVSNTWYDELIIATTRIPDPGVAASGKTPNPPANVQAN